MSRIDRARAQGKALLTTWRLHLVAACWLPAVGFSAYGLSKLAPEGEAAGGVVLAAIALGAYRLSGWALDILASFLVERIVWRLFGRSLSNGDRGEAFSWMVRMLYSSGRDPHFFKKHELQEELQKTNKHLDQVAGHLKNIEQTYGGRQKDFASLTPRRHIRVAKMMDLSTSTPPLKGVGDSDSDEDLADTVFEMPDGSFWRAASYIGGGSIRVNGLYGDRDAEYIELRRLGE